MNSEIKIKTYEEWLKYYENATKEDIIYDLTKDVEYFADAVKDIKQLQQELTDYKERNEKAIEYIENNSLYEEEYDYDYEENMYLSGINDEYAKKNLLEILDKKDKES